jgi:uncharacterized membrane protein YhfC
MPVLFMKRKEMLEAATIMVGAFLFSILGYLLGRGVNCLIHQWFNF